MNQKQKCRGRKRANCLHSRRSAECLMVIYFCFRTKPQWNRHQQIVFLLSFTHFVSSELDCCFLSLIFTFTLSSFTLCLLKPDFVVNINKYEKPYWSLQRRLWTFRKYCPQFGDFTPRTVLQDLNLAPGSSDRNACLVSQKVLCSLGKLLHRKHNVESSYIIKTYIFNLGATETYI